MITQEKIKRELSNGLEAPEEIIEDMYKFINKILRSKSLDQLDKYRKDWEHIVKWEY